MEMDALVNELTREPYRRPEVIGLWCTVCMRGACLLMGVTTGW